MWRTSQGNRILVGREARLFRASLGFLLDTIKQDGDDAPDPWRFGVDVFDDLAYGQKLAILAEVATGLLLPSTGTPRLNAVNEAAVAAIYENLNQCVQFELDSFTPNGDGEVRTYWRQMILDAFQHYEKPGSRPEDEPLPPADCEDDKEWELLVEVLLDTIVHDDDWNMQEQFLDMPAEIGDRVKRDMAIDPEYFRSVAPDPTPEEIELLENVLHALAGE